MTPHTDPRLKSFSSRQRPACSLVGPPAVCSTLSVAGSCLLNHVRAKSLLLNLAGQVVACLALSGPSVVSSISNLVRAGRRLFNLVRAGGRRQAAAYSNLSEPAVTSSNLSGPAASCSTLSGSATTYSILSGSAIVC